VASCDDEWRSEVRKYFIATVASLWTKLFTRHTPDSMSCSYRRHTNNGWSKTFCMGVKLVNLWLQQKRDFLKCEGKAEIAYYNEWPWFDPRPRQFFLHNRVQTDSWGLHKLLPDGYLRFFAIDRPKHETGHSNASGVEVKNVWSLTHALPCAFYIQMRNCWAI
jgi:hypothetical protein